MRTLSLIVIVAAMLTAGCARRIPDRAGVAPGTPHISWIIMSGDRDNADQEFVCQSDPRNDCVVPASRSDAQVFSDVHVYYHGAGSETKYAGPIQIGFFRGSGPAHDSNITVPKNESIANQSITGIVADTPGEYAVTFDLMVTSTAGSQPIHEQVAVIVK